MTQGTVREAQERHSKARVAARSKSDFFFDWKRATIKAPDSAHVFSKLQSRVESKKSGLRRKFLIASEPFNEHHHEISLKARGPANNFLIRVSV